MLIFLIVIVGFTYAAYTFSKIRVINNKLTTGDIYIRYKEGNALNIREIMPSATYPATAIGNYFEFQIIGKNTSTTKDITYNVNLAYGNQESGKTRISEQYLLFKLVEVINNVE